METLILLILLNGSDGSQAIQSATAMPESACIDVMRSIWAGSSPVVYVDSEGNRFRQIDAACVFEFGGMEE